MLLSVCWERGYMLFAEWVQIGIKEKGRSIWDIRKHTTNWRNSGSYMS